MPYALRQHAALCGGADGRVLQGGIFERDVDADGLHAGTAYTVHPAPSHRRGRQAVGNGDDYAATAHGIITSASGAFPAVTGRKSESDGGGSSATFNRGTRITPRDGNSQPPVCTANAGTTGETNNLSLGACKAGGGSTPYARFVEHN